MSNENEPPKEPRDILLDQMCADLARCRAEIQAQNLMIKALIGTHLVPDLVMDAFQDYCEKSMSRALASTVGDSTIEGFEKCREDWMTWIRPHAAAVSRRGPIA